MRRHALCGMLVAALFAVTPSSASASWETGARVNFDSNVNLSVNDEESDTFFSAYLSFSREASGASRLGWTLDSSIEGAAYVKLDDLDYASVSIAPGLSFIPFHAWSIQVSPFLQAKGVKDSEQSAFAFGAKLSLRQSLGKDLYSGEYYVYKDSRADVDTYSFTEHVAGAFLGVSWTRRFFTEAGYEFARGDSFRTVNTVSTTSTAAPGPGSGPGRGRHGRFSSTFDAEVIREKVSSHSLWASFGIDWTRSLFSQAGYSFTTTDGDLGTSDVHGVSAGIGYRF
ncbi:MAG: hypothetical protein AB1640_10765 [bacterium]